MLSNHDTTIGIWLAKFKSFLTFNKKKCPLFKNVVTDFRFALVIAVTLFWNSIDLKTYLLLTFNALESNNNSKIDKLLKYLFVVRILKKWQIHGKKI